MNPVILVADDHIMIAKGLRMTIEYEFGFKQIESVISCKELLKVLRQRNYTHLILDIGLSDGSALDLLPTIQDLYPDIAVMIFSAKPAAAFERVFKAYNINHYMSKAWGDEETKRRLQSFFLRKQEYGIVQPAENPFNVLSPREQEVLNYILEGTAIKIIAGNLKLRHNTVSTIKKRIFDKTKVSNLRELIDLSESWGIRG